MLVGEQLSAPVEEPVAATETGESACAGQRTEVAEDGANLAEHNTPGGLSAAESLDSVERGLTQGSGAEDAGCEQKPSRLPPAACTLVDGSLVCETVSVLVLQRGSVFLVLLILLYIVGKWSGHRAKRSVLWLCYHRPLKVMLIEI